MELTNKEYLGLALLLGLLIISFVSGAFFAKMQLNDQINHTREFCANMTQRVNFEPNEFVLDIPEDIADGINIQRFE